MVKPLTAAEFRQSVAEDFSAAVESTCQDLIKAAVLAEREACLKACEQIAAKYHMKRYATDWQAQECIAAIKARGDA